MSDLENSIDYLTSGTKNTAKNAKPVNAKKANAVKNAKKQVEESQEESADESTLPPANDKNAKASENANKGKGKAKNKHKNRVLMSKKAGITFPAGRLNKLLKRGNYGYRISPASGIYMAASLEYLVAEVLELAGNCAKERKKHEKHNPRIGPRDIQLAIRNDEELSKLLDGVTISEGGVMPHIHPELLPSKNSMKVRENERTGSQEY